ncbi:DUF2225 domain-containing protein [Bacillus methanolicus]|uniref:DUF2225 domain-containing protein n=1 Tax=Bacillus methanolicus (strain MGA3 / ATCC 53907) TaxID=796606 RepID=I3DUK5_BACMM|nr:DUF2225 domain-containing protein [Bacillus methanolicus]AIE61194.1 hypothetical protein BMMGA3_14180 [Bacillus methanolicus MGA3]EIJ77926.1 hypothetical protein MGA3_16286 [Bacillus methanolicus MGA3]UQD53187.1 DUF2225 domain-containing protein [Bacillus methanolicus]
MAGLTPLYNKTYQCMMCKNTFSTKKVRSRFVKVTGYDSDFRPVYESDENNPILYFINVCPHCGFSFSDDSSPYFPPGTKEEITQKICKQWVPQNFGQERTVIDSIKTYKLAAYCATLKKEKHIVIAGMYMRLAWLYRSINNVMQEQRFMKLAINEYMESYSNGDYQGTQVSEIRILYLIGELSRRIHNIKQATQFFSKVIEKQSRTVETKIVGMAKDRWHEIRELQKNT